MFDFMLSNFAAAWNPFTEIWEGIKKIEGWIMNIVFVFFDNVFHIQNIGLAIIFFTIIVYTLMLPLNYKQQKFSHMNKAMSPEITKLREKYKGKQDQESMMKQNEELRAIYQKYGVSPSGSCLQMIITLPILFALYQIIYNIPQYVSSVKDMYSALVDKIMATPNYEEMIRQVAESTRRVNVSGEMNQNLITQVLYNFQSSNWDTFSEKFSNISPDVINNTRISVENANKFLFLNIAESPSSTLSKCMADGFGGLFQNGNWIILLLALLIPILSGLFQWLSVKVIPQPDTSGAGQAADTTAKTMSTMNNVMPIISVVMCFTLPLGIGIYWTASSMYRFISYYVINKKMDKMDIDEIIKKNQEKVNKKREKKGLPPQKVTASANINARTAGSKTNSPDPSRIRENVKKSTEYYNKNADKPGSLASKANMVRQFDEKNAKKKNKKS